MPYGYCGKILRINLSSGEVKEERPEERFYRQLLGGRNLVAYYLLKEVPPHTDPLGPENKLVIAASVITGTTIPGSSRFSMGAKSPLTNGYGESEAGGWWGPELKRAGFDAIIIEGRAQKPVYLWIKDGQVEICDARRLWSRDTGEVEDLIREELADERVRILQTGPAGEKLVRFAAVTNELRHWCGRCGLGAVMGSKNLRAVAVRGTGKVQVKEPERITEFAKWFGQNVGKHPGLVHNMELGTAKNAIPLSEMGLAPTRNFKKGSFEEIQGISGEYFKDSGLLKGRDSCYACPIRCKRVVGYKGPTMSIEERYGGPEWESIGSLGSNCEVGDGKIVCKANELCARYGLDTISTGVTVAFAMECYEKGLLTDIDTGGIALTFGNGDAMLKVIELIAKREGIGDLLAEGSYRVGLKIGRGAEKLSMTSKQQEFPAHEPRGKWGVALSYAVSPSGADHLIAAHDSWFENEPRPEERLWFIDVSDMNVFGITEPVPAPSLSNKKVRLYVHLELLWSLFNVLDLCIFVGVPEYRMMDLQQLMELLKHVTGWDISFWELMKISEKGINMARLFNTKHGIGSEQDTLPDRMFEPLENGAFKDYTIDREVFEKAKLTYYQIRGWSDNGVPTYGKFVELGLEELYGQ